MALPPSVPIEQLVKGTEYMIEVPKVTAVRNELLEQGKKPTFSGITFAKYLGYDIYDDREVGYYNMYTTEEEEEEQDEEEQDDEYDVEIQYYFKINNYNGAGDDERTQINNGDKILTFERPPNYDPDGKNILLNNASICTAYKWCENNSTNNISHGRNVDIPESVAIKDLVFYKRIDSPQQAVSDVLHKQGITTDILPNIMKMVRPSGGKRHKSRNKSNKKSRNKSKKKSRNKSKKKSRKSRNKKI